MTSESPYPGERRVALAANVRELDRRAVEEYGVPSALLMENAGRALCFEVERRLLEVEGRRVLILVGPGNNGGDGLVVARRLRALDVPVAVFSVGDLERARQRSGDLDLQLDLWDRMGGSLQAFGPGNPLEACDLAVDALLGTGLDRQVEGLAAEALTALGALSTPVVACDLPSGLHADHGTLLGPAVPAVSTVTFACWKPGLLKGDGPSLAGAVTVAEIGIPPVLIRELEPLENHLG